MLSKPATRMKHSGKAEVQARISWRTSSGLVQPYMGSFHITQQPLLRRYWTWRATSWSERGGRKEKVSKNLLPWGCHTIMELVLAALPVETTGALLRTGATAEIAAILEVDV